MGAIQVSRWSYRLLVTSFSALVSHSFGIDPGLQTFMGGLIFSFALCFGGLFAFTVHTYFLGKGHTEFNKPISKFILVAILLVSLVQLAATLYVMMTI